MRILVIGLGAALLALPFATPSHACEDYAELAVSAAVNGGQTAFAQATSAEAAKKPMKKKMAVKKKPKEKVQYMRAVPM